MSQQELLATVACELESAGIEYMLTGSFASSLHGEPRATHDVDLVVAIDAPVSNILIRAFSSPDYYLSDSAVLEAIRLRTMFNLIDTRSGDKVDFWVLTDGPFDRSRFARKRAEMVFGGKIYVSSPEDTILAKLDWSKRSGGSEKQFGDALGVYEVQYGTLDMGYLELWAERLGVTALWRRLRDEAYPVE